MLSDVIYVPAKINRPDYRSHTSVIQNLFRFIYGSFSNPNGNITTACSSAFKNDCIRQVDKTHHQKIMDLSITKTTSSHSLKCSWILLRMFMLILLSTMLMARPLLPNRPVRPILCRYVSLSGLPSLSTGMSKLITTETCSTSMPGCKEKKERTFITDKIFYYDPR